MQEWFLYPKKGSRDRTSEYSQMEIIEKNLTWKGWDVSQTVGMALLWEILSDQLQMFLRGNKTIEGSVFKVDNGLARPLIRPHFNYL